MTTILGSNKTKIAKRVIEVFEFFDNHKSQATVMDIARRYGRPQSSTSELLASLVEMGFLYKDQRSRSYMPTPRVGILGTSAQPAYLTNGYVHSVMDNMATRVGHGMALMGIVGTHVQLFGWVAGATKEGRKLGCGMSETLSDSIGGLLLLSTQKSDQYSGLLRRLNAEAHDDHKFNQSEIIEQVGSLTSLGYAIGASGFVPGALMCAVLLPHPSGERPLALGATLDAENRGNAEAILDELRTVAANCCEVPTMARAAA